MGVSAYAKSRDRLGKAKESYLRVRVRVRVEVGRDEMGRDNYMA